MKTSMTSMPRRIQEPLYCGVKMPCAPSVEWKLTAIWMKIQSLDVICKRKIFNRHVKVVKEEKVGSIPSTKVFTHVRCNGSTIKSQFQKVFVYSNIHSNTD